MAELSVIVPFCNVESYLEAALDSIACQSVRDLEIVLVDDGSTDASTAIAEKYAERDPRFRLIRQRNEGPGPARNIGVRHATGKYLAFVDGDDLLAPHAYELLLGSLEKTGSDIACGGVLRFSPANIWPSPAHREIFKTTAHRTHASRYPALLQDRTPWNKVFRRSFWDSAGIEFPPGLYEDAPPMVRAHVMAAATDVLQDIVYYWRLRHVGELSTTQRTRELSNIEGRMTSLRTIGGFLAASAPTLKPSYDRFALGIDIPVLADALEAASDAGRERIMELAAGYLATVDESVYPQLPVITRLHCHLMKTRMLPELIEVLKTWQRDDGFAGPVVRHGHRPARWYAEYPYFRDASRGIPDTVYEASSEMTLTARLDEVTWREGKLRIEGHAYIERLDAPAVGDTQIRVTLRNSKARRILRPRVQRIRRPDVTARSGQAAACYDWSGFAVEVAPWRLATVPGVWRGANWEVTVRVSGSGISREGPVSDIAPGSATWPEGRWVEDGIWVQPAPEPGRRFVVRGRRVTAFATACRVSDGVLQIEGWSTFPMAPDAKVIIKPRRGGAPAIRVPAETAPSGDPPGRGQRRGRQRTAFRARIPVVRLISSAEAGVSAIDQSIHVHDEVTCDISLDAGGAGTTRLTAAPRTAGARASHCGREITVFVTPFGYLSILERSSRLVVSQLDWDHPSPAAAAEGAPGTPVAERIEDSRRRRLILRGSSTSQDCKPASLLLRHASSGSQRTIPLAWDSDQFTAEFAPGELSLASGNWNLLARDGTGAELTVAVARNLLLELPGYLRVGLHEMAPRTYRTDALRLVVRTALSDSERGRYAQRRLQLSVYPAAAGRPLTDLAVFSSFGGREYSCNPRAIYEEMRRRKLDLDYAWVTYDGQFGAPEGSRLLLADSRDYYEALARARYLICNDMLPPWFRKREGQRYLQTWHGTPLKHLGLDIKRPQFLNGLIYPDLIREDAAQWDILLAQNAFSVPLFRRAFGFHGEIAETGYPRNDMLRHPRRGEFAAAARQRLGLPAGKKVILYAPTWRDDAVPSGSGYRFSLQLDPVAAATELGDDYVLLLRMHRNINAGSRLYAESAAVRDVTAYPDITDLLLIADVLITDYSSVMFDFASTGRPILFFTYDLERYRDRLRGLYLDLEADAPGPLLTTSAELIAAVRDIDQITRSYQQARDAFAARFCPLDDGHAAARAVDCLLRVQQPN